MRYWLGELLWRTRTGLGFGWRLPAGATCAIDLRGLDAMGPQALGLRNVALFATPDNISLAATHKEFAAAGTLAGRDREAWQSLLGLPALPAADTLQGLLLWQLGEGSAPDGDGGPRPILPNDKGMMRLEFPGLTTQRKWDPVRDAKTIDVLRADYRLYYERAASREYAEPMHRKVLGAWRTSLGLTGDQWKLLIPADVEKESPREPTTRWEESFVKSNSSTLGPDQTWTEPSGADDFEIISNTARRKTTTSSAANRVARCSTALSSANHQVSVAGTRSTGAQYGATTRLSSDGLTYYAALNIGDSGGGFDNYLLKNESGSETELLANSTAIGVDGYRACRANGSAISLRAALASVFGNDGVTDTSISSGLNGGIYLHSASAANQRITWAEGFDLVESGGGGGGRPRFGRSTSLFGGIV